MSFQIENTKKESSFTSTGEKILHHKDALNDLKNKRNHPIVLHIMPTEVCNLRCVFCSVAQRGDDDNLYKDLTMEQIDKVVQSLKKKGLKAVILSGGGEPTIYSKINELIEYLHDNGLQIGLITNGTTLASRVKPENIDKITWIRVSINSFDYLDDIKMPILDDKKTTLGFSYIWNPLTTKETIDRVKQKVEDISKTNNVAYVRLLPDCNLDTDKLEEAHNNLRKVAEELGSPFFHQYKTHETPKECHLGRVHPVFYTDGYIYPCDSLVLNAPADNKKFNPDFALCHWDEIDDFIDSKIEGSLIDTKKCHHCVFARQNQLLTKIINNDLDLGDPTENLTHINFI